MPRPKPSKASPFFYLRGRELREGARSKLIELLGYRKVDPLEESARHQSPGMTIEERIETALGIYVDGSDHLDHIPRPADYVATFKPIRRDAFKLLNTLHELTEYYCEQLMLKGVVVHEFNRELASFVDAANAVVKDFENLPSKGARKENALTATIRQLRRIFRDHYEGLKDSRRKRGGLQYRADWEKRELEFVELALRDSRIIKKGYKDLPRLFRDPRSIPREEKGER